MTTDRTPTPIQNSPRLVGADYTALTTDECRSLSGSDSAGTDRPFVANADGRCIGNVHGNVGEATSDRWRTPIVVGDVRLEFEGSGVRPYMVSIFVGGELVADADADGPFRLISGSPWRAAIKRPSALGDRYYRALRAVLEAEASPRALPAGDRRPIGALP